MGSDLSVHDQSADRRVPPLSGPHGADYRRFEAAQSQGCARVRLENEIRGLLKTFGVMFGKRVGGFKRRAEEIIERKLAVAPELVPIFEALTRARRDILARIAALDSRIRAIAKRHATVGF